MKTNKLQDIPRNELLDRIEQNWMLRRKAWAYRGTIKGKEAFGEASDLLCDDWEGHPLEPRLIIVKSDLYLDEAISISRMDSKYFIKDMNDKYPYYIGWHQYSLADFNEKFEPILRHLVMDASVFKENKWAVWRRE